MKNIESNLYKLDPEISSNIRSLPVQTLNSFLSSSSFFSKIDSRLLCLTKIIKKFLSDHPDLIITKMNKGNMTVALDQDDYFNKMYNLLSDKDTYTMMNCDPTKKITNKLKDLLQHWRKKNYITNL